jgi:hypothetical protein
MLPLFHAQPPQEGPLQQLGVEPVGLRPAVLPRYGDTRGMDHMRLDPTRIQPTRQPEAVAASFEGKRNPRDLFTGPDRFIAPAMQQAKQPFGARLQLLARLTLNAGKHTGNQPARLAQLDDGNDRAILVQGDEGPAQVIRLGHQGTPSVTYSDDGAISFAACPIPSRRWRGRDSNPRSPVYGALGRARRGCGSARFEWHLFCIFSTIKPPHPPRIEPQANPLRLFLCPLR